MYIYKYECVYVYSRALTLAYAEIHVQMNAVALGASQPRFAGASLQVLQKVKGRRGFGMVHHGATELECKPILPARLGRRPPRKQCMPCMCCANRQARAMGYPWPLE